MKTEHYIVGNIAEFSEQTKAVKKLEEYLNYIEGIFPVIEEIFGEVWNDDQINIALDDLFACNFVFFRFGRIPTDSLDKVKLFLNKPFIF